MTIRFEHPVGAQADTKELEYVAALLQTAARARSDATVDSQDIYYYLKSRHGLKVHRRYIERHLLPELAGNIHFQASSSSTRKKPVKDDDRVDKSTGSVTNASKVVDLGAAETSSSSDVADFDGIGKSDSDDVQDSNDQESSSGFHSEREEARGDEIDNDYCENESFMDLCQVLAIVLIPFFVASSRYPDQANDKDQENQERRKSHLPESGLEAFDKVFQAILTDVLGGKVFQQLFGDEKSLDGSGNDGEEKKGLRLSKDLLTDILETYGEVAIPDRILEEMLEVAGGEGCAFNARTLIRAMSKDVQQYDVDWANTSATHYADILGDKKTTDFWCMQATKRDGGDIAKHSKTIGKDLKTYSKTVGGEIPKNRKLVIDKSKTAKRKLHNSHGTDGYIEERGRHSLFVDDIDACEDKGGCSENNSNNELCAGEDERQITTENECKGLYHDDGDQEHASYKQFYSAPSIDFTAESYRSQTFFTAVWLTLVVVYFAYFFNFSSAVGRLDCQNTWEGQNSSDVSISFFCLLAQATVNWILKFLYLSIMGSLFVFFGSFGASASNSIWPLFVGMLTVVVFCVLPYFYEVETAFFSTVKKDGWGWGYFYLFALVVGLFLLLLQFVLTLRTLLPRDKLMWFRRITVTMTNGMVRKETRTKQAAVFKINRLLDHALDMHQEDSMMDSTFGTRNRSGGATSRGGTANLNSTGRALLNYQLMESCRAQSGGPVWTWKKIIDKSIFKEEGVWFHSRLITSNFFQLVVCVIVFILVAWFMKVTTSFLGDPQTLEPLPSISPFPTTSPTMVPSELGATAIPTLSNDGVLLPKRWQVEVGIFIGGVAGFFSALFIAFIYLPSAVSTTLKFRYGEIPSLGNRTFQKYREAVDLVSMMFGSMFWGCVVTALASFTLFGVISFLFAYHVTRPYAAWGAANIIGFSVTLGIKVGILTIFRRYFYCGMYRRKVAAANCMGLMLDCWYLGLSVGYMTVRALILFSISVIFVGRVDTPVLAEGVGHIGPVVLDSYPITFRKDILLHEAHRHPYIERLGAMYLMKIKFGNNFSSRAGAIWRLLFVLALFPWLRKYRFPQLPSLPDEVDFDVSEAILMEEGEVSDDFDNAIEDYRDAHAEEDQALSSEEQVVLGKKENGFIGQDLQDEIADDGPKSGFFWGKLLSILHLGGTQAGATPPPNAPVTTGIVETGAKTGTEDGRPSLMKALEGTIQDCGVKVATGAPPRRPSDIETKRRRSANVEFAQDALLNQQRSKRRLSQTSTAVGSRAAVGGNRKSLADISGNGGQREFDVLLKMENDSLRKQNQRLIERLQALNDQQQQYHQQKKNN